VFFFDDMRHCQQMKNCRHEAQAAKGDWPTDCAFGCYSASFSEMEVSLQVANEQSMRKVGQTIVSVTR